MNQAANWGRLPAELRQLNQWVLAGPDKTPLSVTAQGQLYAASSTEPAQWLPYEAAAHYAVKHGMGIGFVLSANDPYTCVDFDVKDASNEPDPNKHTHIDAYWYFWELAQKWDSYT
jgi:primase-polymerase (primpol)-like protein